MEPIAVPSLLPFSILPVQFGLVVVLYFFTTPFVLEIF